MKSIQLGKDPVYKIFWKYAIPSIIAMLAQTTAGMIDSIFIGRFIGPEGLSAITLFFPFLGLLIGIGAMFAIGSSTLAGIELGKGNFHKSNNFFNLAVWVLTILSLSATLIIFLLLPKLAKIMSVTGITKQYMSDYGYFLSPFFMFFMLNFVFSFFFKLDGKPSTVVRITLSGTIINIILDILFVAIFKWSLKGAALATGLSQLIPWILFIYISRHTNWHFKKPKIFKKEIMAICFNGFSELMSNIAHALAGLIFNFIIIKEIGVKGVAAYSIALNISGIAAAIGYGFAESNQSGVSFNLGAQQLARVKHFRNLTRQINLLSGLLLFVLVFVWGGNLSKLFVSDMETIALADTILKYYAFAFMVMGVNISISTYYTAVNDPILSAGVSFYRSFIGLVIGLMIFPHIWGPQGIWLTIIFTEFTTFVAGLYLYHKKPFGLNSSKAINRVA